MANSVDPYQTAPIGEVCSGSTLYASILNSSVIKAVVAGPAGRRAPDHFFGRLCFPPCPFFSFQLILLFTLNLFNLPKFIDTRCAFHQ